MAEEEPVVAVPIEAQDASAAPVETTNPTTTEAIEPTSEPIVDATIVEQDFISLSEEPAINAPASASVESVVPNAVNIQALLDELAAQNAAASAEPLVPDAEPTPTGTIAGIADDTNPAPVDVLPSVAAHHIQTQSSLPSTNATSITANLPLPVSSAEAQPANTESSATVANVETSSTAPGTSNGISTVPTDSTVPLTIQGQPLTHPLPSPAFSANGRNHEEADGPFTAEMEKDYDEFIRDERTNVAEGNWEKFPDGSRLFIGNLPTEKVSKRDVFRRFRRYGKLAQISLKQAYGFVQFLDAPSCTAARDAEQDKQLKGRKMHLEISRPQKSKTRDRDGRRRSRSPERDRARGDRHSGSGQSYRDRDVRRSRDDYRPGRSPSPVRGHRSRGSTDHYTSRRRSRSRTPPRYGNHQQRPSDDLPLPFRSPQEIPEIQVLVVDDIDRQFISYVERAFQNRGIRSDVLILSPRLSEAAVVRRQIVEGVLGVVRLTRLNQATGKLSLQLFDQSAGADRVKFEQYEDLDPQITAELVLRARSTHRAPVRDAYQSSSYGLPASYGLPPAAPAPAAAPTNDVASLLAQLQGRPELQGILAQMSQLQGSNNSANPASALSPDVARMLAGAVAQQQPPPTSAYGQPAQAAQQQSQPSFDLAALLKGNSAAPQSNGAASGQAYGSSNMQQNAQPAQPDMQQLMAQLANYGGGRQ